MAKKAIKKSKVKVVKAETAPPQCPQGYVWDAGLNKCVADVG